MIKFLKYILMVALLMPSITFAQKKEKKHQEKKTGKQEIVIDHQEVTNIFLDATKARLIGDMENAALLFETCLQKNPDHAPSMYELAQIFLSKNETDKAIELAKNAVETEPGNKWYKLLLVDIYGRAGKKNDLMKICQQLVKEEPGNAEYLYELANAYIENNEASNAVRTYDQIEEIVGINEEISVQKYRIYLFQKKTSEAIGELQKLIAEFPEQKSRYMSMIAETYMDTGDDEKAYGYYQKIMMEDPSNPFIHITLSDYYRKKGDKEKAAEELKRGFANPNLDIDTKLRVLLSYYTADEMYGQQKKTVSELAAILVSTHPADPKAHSLNGDMLYSENKYAEAIGEYRQVLATDSSRYAIWESLMNAELQMGDNASLVKDSEIATQLFPMQPVPYLFRGIALLNIKQADDAIDNFLTGQKMVTGNTDLLSRFYTYLGEAYNQVNDYRQSDDNYEKALKLEPENSYVLNNYAYYLSIRGEKLEKAEAMSAKSLELDPGNPANMDTYGWILFRLGRYNEALTWVEKAVSLTPKGDPDLLEHLGDINFKLGSAAKAQELWRKAIELGSESEGLKKKVKEGKLNE